MSDPEARQPEKPRDVDDVVGSANAGLDAAAAARADVAGSDAEAEAERTPADANPERQHPPVDPDLAAFETAERDHPGTFSSTAPAAGAVPVADRAAAAEQRADSDRLADDRGAERLPADRLAGDRPDDRVADDRRDADATAAFPTPGAASWSPRHEESSMADTAYAPHSDDADTRIVPSEPYVGTAGAAAAQPQPIFVQAPEPPRDRGNRGTAGAIGLLATVAFAILYLGTAVGLRAIAGDVTGENIGEAFLAPLLTWGYWTPVVVFFLGFWLLGAIINRGRWGLWVVFGIIVGLIAYAGHILGQLFEAPFWKLTASQGLELAGEQLLAPLAIAAFVFARELTIWFGAWVARSGARKTELNAEAQREYERTLEAGPTLAR
ncbi:ABC transporter [Microbacterium sp. SSW1-47]|uniref:ABC transporter n=1 Tax=Microbacterium TaxID=33882 RepID=UPI001FFC536F|nr:ABC transporter [Microbacterium sufflavum]MCK2024912.1 ABC transporter [Microbacterium sufflavum]